MNQRSRRSCIPVLPHLPAQTLAAALASLPHLRCLDLSGTAVTPEGVAELARALPQLRALSLAHCVGLARPASSSSSAAAASAANVSWAAALAELPDLQWLDLRGTGAAPAHARALAPAVLEPGYRLRAGRGLMVDGDLARTLAANAEAAAPLQLDTVDDETVNGWRGAELEVSCRGCSGLRWREGRVIHFIGNSAVHTRIARHTALPNFLCCRRVPRRSASWGRTR